MNTIEKTCTCGKKFFVKKYREKTAKYCSNKCRWEHTNLGIPWNRGKKFFTEEELKEHKKECTLKWAREHKDKRNTRRRLLRRISPKYRSERILQSSTWRKQNPEKMAFYKRKSILKCKYGITIDQYNEMLSINNGGCYVCGKIPKNTTAWDRLCIDHNHITGKTRGLLCHSCNRSLGLLGDNIDRLKNIIIYLEKYDI